MNTKEILEALKLVKEHSKKRKFNQTYDFVIVLKNIDLKKTEQHIDFFTSLHFPIKKRSICGIVGGELLEQAKSVFDEVISVEDFPKYKKDKKLTKKLAQKHDFFVAQASIMAQIAQTFGRVFGPKGKMPNPKAGCVVPPNANLKPVYEKLQLIVNPKAKSHLMMQISVGREDMKDEEVAENIHAIYDQIIHHLPLEKNNIKNSYLKLTMGKPIKIGKEGIEEQLVKEKKEEKVKVEEKVKQPKEKKTDEAKPEEKKEAPKEIKEEKAEKVEVKKDKPAEKEEN